MISLVVYLFAILFPVQKTQNYIVCKAKAKQSISTKDKVKSLIKNANINKRQSEVFNKKNANKRMELLKE